MTTSRKAKALQFADEGYNIQITGRHLQVTDAMSAYAMEKVSKIERFINRIIDVNIILDIQKLEHRVEIILKAGHIKIRSLATSHDMYSSIDKAVHKIEAQLLKYKDKIQDYHNKGRPAIDMSVKVIRSPEEGDSSDDLDEINAENVFHTHKLVAQETIPLKVLTIDEAMMKMELSRDSFLIFKCEEDQKIKVIYRRNDQNYGIIEPQL
jgi:putative sigma-54 modulation protein